MELSGLLVEDGNKMAVFLTLKMRLKRHLKNRIILLTSKNKSTKKNSVERSKLRQLDSG